MTSVALLVVNYRASALALDAIRTARAATARPLQVIAVDNSVDAAEADALRGAADTVIASATNAGYAAAINAGRRACDAEIIVVSNPDVRFAAGAIDALADAGAAVAGPALFWDDAHQWLLPPSDLWTAGQILDRAVASRSPGWRRRRDRRRFFQRLRFWSLSRTVRVGAISGAVMAIRAKAFDDAGGFDERFRLYFEENDFLRRVRGEIAYVPAARCRHLYNQSAAGSDAAAAAFAESELRYLRKWNAILGPLAKRLERPMPAVQLGDRATTNDQLVIEASPLPSFETAAGSVRGSAAIPADVWRAYRGDALYLRAVDRVSGEPLAAWRETRIPA